MARVVILRSVSVLLCRVARGRPHRERSRSRNPVERQRFALLARHFSSGVFNSMRKPCRCATQAIFFSRHLSDILRGPYPLSRVGARWSTGRLSGFERAVKKIPRDRAIDTRQKRTILKRTIYKNAGKVRVVSTDRFRDTASLGCGGDVFVLSVTLALQGSAEGRSGRHENELRRRRLPITSMADAEPGQACAAGRRAHAS